MPRATDPDASGAPALPGNIAAGRHVVIAGPTASGKSALALAIARAQGGVVVNADALQVWACWRVLTARPGPQDEAAAPHALYGHVAAGQGYSVGDWLADVTRLKAGGRRLIVVGGTGLYLTALTGGLAVIPPVPAAVRAEADALAAAPGGLARMVAGIDARTAAGIDLANPARVQRAWEVQRASGRGLAAWQAETGPPLIAPGAADCLVLGADRGWLAARIAARFDAMLAGGAIAEVRAMAPLWSGRAQWARAIGAAEILAHLRGEVSLAEARERAIIATRRYAKAQRSWFRNRMRGWTWLSAEDIATGRDGA